MCIPMFTVLCTIAEIRKQVLLYRQMDKEDVVHTCNRILFSQRKKEILPFVTLMDLVGPMLSEISQTEKGKYCIISLVCGILKKKKKLIGKKIRQVVTRRRGLGKGDLKEGGQKVRASRDLPSGPGVRNPPSN